MKRSKSQPPRPTQAELDILRVLWTRGPSSVREVHEALSGVRPTGYTTILKLLQIMTAKRLVERAFGGSASRLIQQALATTRATREEMAEIRKLLQRATGGKS